MLTYNTPFTLQKNKYTVKIIQMISQRPHYCGNYTVI